MVRIRRLDHVGSNGNSSGKDGRADADGLAVHLRQTLPNFMQPQAIEWRDTLPRNPNGKLDRVAIAAGWAKAVAA